LNSGVDVITVYGADWCEDTRRSLRLLRRLHVPHEYVNIDENDAALWRAKELNGGKRRTPTIDLGVGGPALVEPSNDTLAGALIELSMLTQDQAYERMAVQNVGDSERVLRTAAGALVLLASAGAPRGIRLPFGIVGTLLALTGLTGWCPVYHAAGMTSLGGPGDHREEAERRTWLIPRARRPEAAIAGDAA
jgi:mycoredoxin